MHLNNRLQEARRFTQSPAARKQEIHKYRNVVWGGGGMNWETGINTYTLLMLCIK